MASLLETLELIVGKRWPLIAAVFALELLMIIGVANSAFLPHEYNQYEKQYTSSSQVLSENAVSQVAAIFANNFRVATVELTPLLGPIIFALSLYETARIVEVIAVVKGVSVGLAIGNLFALPSTWLELPAYAIAVSESVYLLYALYVGFRQGWARFLREIRFLVVNVMVLAAVLIVAATFEVTEIQFEQGPPEYQVLALLTWLPFVLVFAGVYKFWKRARRDAPELEAREAAEAQPSPPPFTGESPPSPQPAPDGGPAGPPA